MCTLKPKAHLKGNAVLTVSLAGAGDGWGDGGKDGRVAPAGAHTLVDVQQASTQREEPAVPLLLVFCFQCECTRVGYDLQTT